MVAITMAVPNLKVRVWFMASIGFVRKTNLSTDRHCQANLAVTVEEKGSTNLFKIINSNLRKRGKFYGYSIEC
jgi:hypothetical protein